MSSRQVVIDQAGLELIAETLRLALTETGAAEVQQLLFAGKSRDWPHR
jgi:hypothetical protein